MADISTILADLVANFCEIFEKEEEVKVFLDTRNFLGNFASDKSKNP